MRQRRKHNLDGQLERCKGYLLSTPPASSENALLAVNEKAYFDWDKVFIKDLPISLEIGCGKGAFAVEFCKRNPNKNLIAVERNANIIVSALMNAEEVKPTNLMFLHSPCEVLTRFFRPSSVQEIFLNFSTPLPRTPYIRQRLTHPRFLALYKEMLVPGGKIFFKTDSKDFFEYSKEQMEETGFEILRAETDLYKADDLMKDNIQTEYERRFVNMGLPIYMIIAKKKDK